jgi:hypothetical protein
MNMLKNIRFIVVILFLVAFAYFIFSPYVLVKSGVVVISVSNDSKCASIKEGDVITNVLGNYVKNNQDFLSVEKNVKANEYVTMLINNGPGGCLAARDGYLGITASDIPSNEIKFGIDIQGGVTTVLKPEGNLSSSQLESIVQLLDKRINAYGLQETDAYASNSFIKINSLSSEKIGWLIETGKFEAKILEEVKLQENIGKIPVGDNSYSVEKLDDRLKINNSFYKIGDGFELENMTNDSVAIEGTVFENKDIVRVLSGSSTSYNSNTRAYEFSVHVEITNDASNRFTKIVKRMPTTVSGNQVILNGFLVYYLDGRAVSHLSIPIETIRQSIKQISVIGFSTSMSDASITKSKVFGALVSGDLTTNLQITGTEKYEPKLKIFSMEVFGSAIGLVAIAVLSISVLRYKDVKCGGLIIILGLIELFLIIGIISLLQQISGANWIINLTTIFGLIGAFVASSLRMVSGSEKILKRNEMAIHYKHNKLIGGNMTLNLAIIIIVFVFLFTYLRFVGLTLLTGFVFDVLLIKPIYLGFIKNRSV